MNATTDYRKLPRRKGAERRPTLSKLARAGLAELPAIIPASAMLRPEIAAAVRYCARVAAWDANETATALREQAAEMTAAARRARRSPTN